MGTGISYHTFFKFSNTISPISESAVHAFLESCYNVGCFDLYWNKVEVTEKYLIVGWKAVPKYFPEIVESFNNTFKNIKVTVLGTQDVVYTRREYSTSKNGTEEFNAMSVIIAIELSEEYSNYAKKFVWYLVHNLFRMTSLCEEAYDKDGITWKFTELNTDRDFCTLVSNINNYWLSHNYYYRGIEYPFEKEHVQLLDDITLCNKTFTVNSSSIIKQTRVLFELYYNSSLFKSKKTEWENRIKFEYAQKNCIAITNSELYEGKVIGLLLSSKGLPSVMEDELVYWSSKIYDPGTKLLFKHRDGVDIVVGYNTFSLEDRNVIVKSFNKSNGCNICGIPLDNLTHFIYNGICKSCADSYKEKDKNTLPIAYTIHCENHPGIAAKNCKCNNKTYITKYQYGKEQLKRYNLDNIIYVNS